MMPLFHSICKLFYFFDEAIDVSVICKSAVMCTCFISLFFWFPFCLFFSCTCLRSL